MADSARVSRVLTMMSHKLGPRFRSCSFDNHPEWVLGLVEKLPPGQRNPDGTNWTQHGGIDPLRWESIFATSMVDEEVVERLIQFIVFKNDTTVLPIAGRADSKVSASDVAKIVAEQLAVLLKEHADKLVNQRERIDQIAQVAANNAVIQAMPKAPLKSGIQFRPKKAPSTYAKERDVANAMWADRAKILGIGEPILALNKHVDGRWVRRAQKLWDAHVAQKPVATE